MKTIAFTLLISTLQGPVKTMTFPSQEKTQFPYRFSIYDSNA